MNYPFKPTEKNRSLPQSREGAKAQRVFSGSASLRLGVFALKGLFYPRNPRNPRFNSFGPSWQRCDLCA
jgi:hypothetical protein